MSLWVFSESSQPLFKRCIEVATVTSENKWIEKFGFSSLNTQEKCEVIDTSVDNENAFTGVEMRNVDVESDCPVLETNESFCREIINLDPVVHFDYIAIECMKNSNLFLVLAKELHVATVDKLCKHIYETPDINHKVIEKFYTFFLPTFLKREPTRFSFDLLIKSKCNPAFFKHLLIIILNDVELPTNILNDFISTLNPNEQTEFLLSMNQFGVKNDVFLHHLPTIYSVYKNCQKNSEIYNYIMTKLLQISENCVMDKNYGRFLLSLLQEYQYSTGSIQEIKNIVANHKSVFRKPCLNILNEIQNGCP